jgi:hypothetical protein
MTLLINNFTCNDFTYNDSSTNDYTYYWFYLEMAVLKTTNKNICNVTFMNVIYKLISKVFYGKPHGYSSRSNSTRKAVAKQTSPKINRLCW